MVKMVNLTFYIFNSEKMSCFSTVFIEVLLMVRRVVRIEEEGETGHWDLRAGAQGTKPRWVPCRERCFRKRRWHCW